MMIRLAAAGLWLCLAAAPLVAAQPPSAPGGYVPVPDSSVVTEQIPAAPLLIGAYAFFLVAVMFYVWTIWRRLDRVEADMRALEQRTRSGPR